MEGDLAAQEAEKLAPWDVLSRLAFVMVFLLMEPEATHRRVFYSFKAREGRLPNSAIFSWIRDSRWRLEVEVFFFLWAAWTAHGFDQEDSLGTQNYMRYYYLGWMAAAPLLMELLGNECFAWMLAAQFSIGRIFEDITRIGAFKVAFASHMLSFRGSPIDLLLDWPKLPSDYWYRECFRGISAAARLTLICWYCSSEDSSNPFWVVVLEPVALWAAYVAIANLLSCFFRPSEENRSYRILPNSLRYRLNVGKTAMTRALFSGQELVSKIEDSWPRRYRSTKRRYEKFWTVRKLFLLLEALFRWIRGIERGEQEDLADFRYEEIRPNQIRLLQIHKRTLFRAPCCKLVTVNAEFAMDYVACSYVWGDQIRRRDIVLNGYRFLLTDSAYQVIRRKQSFFGESTLWIDSVCINQEDEIEKANQISKMRGIFRNAEQVYAYVNAGKKSSTLKFFMEQLTGEAGGEQLAADTLSPSAYHLRELAEFLSRPWFCRIWVLQEVAVARKLTVINGTDTFDWEYFVAAMRYFKERPNLLGRLRTELTQEDTKSLYVLSRPLDMNIARRGVLLHDHLPLVDLLLASEQCRFSEPHDRVFALLGMAPVDATEAIGIDYNLSASEVYTRTMKYILTHAISKKGGLQHLANAGLQRQTKMMRHFPSWVSSWSSYSRDALLKMELSNSWSATGSGQHSLSSVSFNRHRLKCCTKKIGKINLLLGKAVPNEPFKHENKDPAAPVEFSAEREAVCSAFIDAAEYFEPIAPELEILEKFVEIFHLDPAAALRLREKSKFPSIPEAIGRVTNEFFLETLPPGIRQEALEKLMLGEEGLVTLTSCLLPPEAQQEEAKGEWLIFQNLAGRRFAVIAKTLLSLVPEATLDTDEVHLIAGALTPFVLRPLTGSNAGKGKLSRIFQIFREGKEPRMFQIVGACYVCGAMAGELAEDREEDSEEQKWQDVLIE